MRHIAPNVLTQALVFAMSDIVMNVGVIVTLSYFSLGIVAPTPDWGAMMADRQQFLAAGYLGLTLYPAAAVMVTSLALRWWARASPTPCGSSGSADRDPRPTPPPEPDRAPNVISLDAYQLYGLAGDDITGVDIILSNGLSITASTQNGTWGAWWPKSKGDPTGSRLEIHTADGVHTVAPDDASLDWDDPTPAPSSGLSTGRA